MAFVDILGLGAAATFGVGVGARAFVPALGAVGKGLGGVGKIIGERVRMSVFPDIAKENITRGMWVKAASSGISKIGRAGVGLGKQGMWAGGSVASMGLKTAQFALRHPYMTIAGLGTGAYLATNKSPYSSPSTEGKLEGVRLTASFNEEQIAAQALNEAGVAPMGGIVSGAAIRNQRLMESTQNLTFGLHRSRH